METKYDMAWGNPYFLLDILSEQYTQKLNPFDIKSMIYCPDQGFEELIEITKQTIRETTGMEYKYLMITPGATHAINTVFRCWSDKYDKIVTPQYGFPFYNGMISKAGYTRVEDVKYIDPLGKSIYLIDSPSNPKGLQFSEGSEESGIWDNVYHNKIYTNNLLTIPKHKVAVGSYTKLLGIAGARIGYLATDSEEDFNKFKFDNLMDLATVSIPSQNLIIDIMKKIDLDRFMNCGNRSLSLNKEAFQKIEYLFDNQPVQETGMFYCANVDKKVIDLFGKVGVKFVLLKEDYIRLSMGQTNKITKDCISAIMKGDGK